MKFETASSLSLSSAALLVPALMFAAIVLERGLAQPGLGPSWSDATLFLPIESFEDGPAVFMTAETTWFVVGPLASAGENDGLAAVSEFAGWAAEMFSGNHAVVKTEDVSDLAYATIDDETTDAWPFDDHGSCVCWFPHEGHCCSRSRTWSVAPLWVVFSIFSSVRAIQMLAAFAFPFCFQYLLAALFAAMLMESFCLLRTGFERVRVFRFFLLLDPGSFEHAAHVWKGKLAKDEVKRRFSSSILGQKVFRFLRVGSWLVFSSRQACASSGRRDTGPSLTTTSGMPSLRFPSTSS